MKRVLLTLLLSSSLLADKKVETVEINTPKDWGKEIIQLPPGFAKDMDYKGKEDIRFSPGMFKPAAEDFFTYVFILDGTLEGGLTEKNVKSEILKYYRGLAKAVGGKKYKIEPEKFTLELKKVDGGFNGTLKWIEPFKTGKKQTLFLELKTWESKKKQILFAMVSPAKKDSNVWKKLHEVAEKLTIR